MCGQSGVRERKRGIEKERDGDDRKGGRERGRGPALPACDQHFPKMHSATRRQAPGARKSQVPSPDSSTSEEETLRVRGGVWGGVDGEGGKQPPRFP